MAPEARKGREKMTKEKERAKKVGLVGSRMATGYIMRHRTSFRILIDIAR
jgi:hypothetical protein